MLRTAYRDVIHWSGIVGAAISISSPHHEGRPLLVRVTYVLIAAVAADAPMPIPRRPSPTRSTETQHASSRSRGSA